jgi:hypothetical protein
MNEHDLTILRVTESLAVLVVEMYDDFIRLREAVMADELARQRYSVGFGEKRFLDLQQRAHEVLELIRQIEKEDSPD